MKTNLIIAITALMVLMSCNKDKKVENLSDEKERVSYAIGESFGKNLEQMEESMPVGESPNVDDYIAGIKSVISSTQGKSTSFNQGVVAGSQIANYLNSIKASDKVDYNTMYAAIRAVYNKDSLLIPQDSAGAIIQNYFKPYDEEFKNQQQENQKARLDKEKEENTKASQAFLDANKSKPGVQTTADGLQYKVDKAGEGPSPTQEDKVKIIYTGKTTDGTEFDSSNGQPVEMNISQVVPGFSEGLKLMNKGATYTLYIPANLAYGEQAPPTIGPNQALIFNVQLLDFYPIPPEELKQMQEQQKQREAQMKQMQQMQQAQGAPSN